MGLGRGALHVATLLTGLEVLPPAAIRHLPGEQEVAGLGDRRAHSPTETGKTGDQDGRPQAGSPTDQASPGYGGSAGQSTVGGRGQAALHPTHHGTGTAQRPLLPDALSSSGVTAPHPKHLPQSWDGSDRRPPPFPQPSPGQSHWGWGPGEPRGPLHAQATSWKPPEHGAKASARCLSWAPVSSRARNLTASRNTKDAPNPTPKEKMPPAEPPAGRSPTEQGQEPTLTRCGKSAPCRRKLLAQTRCRR